MTDRVLASTRVLALLGDPVAHSLSPRFQNAALRAVGVDAVYVPLRCAEADLAGLLRGLARAGGGGNVTLPHKELAARTVDRRTPRVERTGACNTFWLENGEVHGDNTDVAGFAAAAREVVGGALTGARVLLLGAGGSASAALVALLDERAGGVTVLNRTAARAETMLARVGAPTGWARVTAEAAALAGERFDLVVNATSLGLRDADPLPLDPAGVVAAAALDLVYAPAETRWVHALRERGVRAADGLGMLLHQGAAAFERWWGIPAPLAAMRAALPPRPDP